MIGPLEIVIVVLIILLVFGGYRHLPAIGRAAGGALRRGGEGARDLAGRASRRAEKIDTDRVVRTAGEGMREVRELRAAVSGESSPERAEEPERAEGPGEAAEDPGDGSGGARSAGGPASPGAPDPPRS